MTSQEVALEYVDREIAKLEAVCFVDSQYLQKNQKQKQKQKKKKQKKAKDDDMEFLEEIAEQE